ncbi:replication endonuclease [Mesorhizobium sp. B2-4-6]|uniref:replication endonuclease n=1 Tax=Mesorhizobium sp. B2-4-6 TaxID=2589943 RepID=UPI0011278C5A|nr:replication endonuclease [Mesorhizobium sp. B2-4-6]TPL45342.1 hypothetical protein FJ957_20750 [Mesorhizobium sp. B2-4-6]
MTPRSGYSPTSQQPPLTLRTKNVDGSPKFNGFSGFDATRLGRVGDGLTRERLRKKFEAARRQAKESDKAARKAAANPHPRWIAAAEAARKAAEDAARELADAFQAAETVRPSPKTATAEEVRAADFADLDAEEARHRPDPRHFRAGTVPPSERQDSERKALAVFKMLPPAFSPFVKDMSIVRKKERGAAILAKAGWDVLETIGLSPSEISERAEKAAARYAVEHPAETHPEPEHRRRRQAKTWRRKMKKAAKKARAYIGYAVSGVGGREREGRPLFVTDYSVICHRADMRDSRENMGRLVILKKEDPAAQIPMLVAHKKKLLREAAKRRLVSDVLLARAKAIGAKAIWITLTLEGQYHCNPTNAGHEVQKWNPMLGPDEAMTRMQELYHQTVSLLRQNGLRPWGFWDAQAQQDGTVHRHILVFVHDRQLSEAEALALLDPDTAEPTKAAIRAASEARALAEARAVADGFWDRFSSTPEEKRQEETKRSDRGCSAYVVGDTDSRYAPPKDKRGREETPEAIVKYASRYSSRLAMGYGDDYEPEGGIPADDAPATDLERHAVWASERDARLHTLIGMDSQRSPGKLWDSIWKAAERGEVPDDARMCLAVREMMRAQAVMDRLTGGNRTRPRQGVERGPEDKREGLRDELAALKAQPSRSVEIWDRIEELAKEIDRLNGEIAAHAYQACIAAGMWADRDLHASEKLWLREALDLSPEEALPLPPIPLRKERDNAYGETVRETVGIAAPVVVATGTARERKAAAEALGEGEMILTVDDSGGWVIVRPSDSPYDQILLRVEEWVIVDKATAAAMVEERRKKQEAEMQAEAERRAAREDLRDACEALYEEGPSSESAWMDSDGEVFETADFEDSDGGLSDIPTDPRESPCGASRGNTGPPG